MSMAMSGENDSQLTYSPEHPEALEMEGSCLYARIEESDLLEEDFYFAQVQLLQTSLVCTRAIWLDILHFSS